MYIYYIYPVGSRHKAAKTSRAWKANWIAFKLGVREAFAMLMFKRNYRPIVVERHNTMYGSAW